MRKISDVKELIQLVEGRNVKDFSNMDLSHLDLSQFDPSFWIGAFFWNTNLSNTGIRFNPESLSSNTIKKCNFENVDLSYIDEDAWCWFDITDANLRNTGVKMDISYCHANISYRDFDYTDSPTMGAVLLDEHYKEKPAEYWDRCAIGFATLRANRFIHISSYKLFKLIQKSLEGKCSFLMPNQLEKLVKQCEGFLKEFDDGEISRLYEIVCKNFSPLDKLKFFQGNVEEKFYQTLTLNGFSAKLLELINFSNCSFEKLEINNPLKALLDSQISIYNEDNKNTFQTIEFPDLNLDSWKFLNPYRNILGFVSFKRFLYLELGMKCNCNCKFCRNKSFDGKCEARNLERILFNLREIAQYVDTIFIGGGEPTLYFDDIIRISESFKNLIIVTNGTMERETLDKLKENNLTIYISRHSISDEENRSILNPSNSTNILSIRDIKEFTPNMNIAFSPVCVKGGLDSSQKVMEYIAMSFECGVKEILISTLHENASLGKKGLDYEDLYVDSNIFNDVFSMLLAQGFERKRTICSTGGYILKRFVKDYSYTVSFKIYISKEEFPHYWKNCVKRTFDFTMTPNGDIYQDWCKNELVNLEKLKNLTEA